MSNSLTYFTDTEVEGLDKELCAMLDKARHTAGIPFRITSGRRTADDNHRAMGVESSAHLKGLAVDLGLGHITDPHERNVARFKMVGGLYSAGFKRILLYESHLHVDIDLEKPHPILTLAGPSH